MNSAWQSFIRQRLSETPAADGRIVLSPLPPTGVLRVHGEDAPTFLQGQATCDIRRISPDCSGIGALCTPQGRVIATVRIVRSETGFLLLLAADLLEKVARRLHMYVLRSRVRVETADLAGFGITAAEAGPLRKILPEPPGSAGAVTRAERVCWLRMPGPGERFLVLGEPEAARLLWLRLVADLNAAEARETHWQLQDIRAGLATVTAATTETFLPQMLNLDRLGGVSFDKGCYTGQEVIARTRYLGEVKRRLHRFRLVAPVTLPPATRLTDGGETVGQVVNAAPAGSSQELLAVVRCDRAHSSALRPAGGGDAALQLLDLAYTSA